MQSNVPLHRLRPGQYGVVEKLQMQGQWLQYLLDMGLTEGCRVRCYLRAPAGDPTAYEIRGAMIALRRIDAANILVRLE